jgi:hypothetical protein
MPQTPDGQKDEESEEEDGENGADDDGDGDQDFRLNVLKENINANEN